MIALPTTMLKADAVCASFRTALDIFRDVPKNGKPNLDPWRLCWFFAVAWNACGVVSAAENQRRLLGQSFHPAGFQHN
jgi:hypothetical protein